MSIENNICQAIDIIVDKAVKEAAYDKTILAQVLSCVDATIGKYKIKYQDNICYAYTNNTAVTYTKGTDVYVLVPESDFSKEKTILGTTTKMGINYISVAEGDEAYEYIGKNCITSNDNFQLSSYKTEEIILYDKKNHKIALDITSVNEYIKNASVIICGGRFRTALKPEHKTHGNYGIKYILKFTDEATGSEVEREYIVDINKMLGDPYELIHEKRQYGIFEIKKENFIEVSSISIFCNDFPIQKEELTEEDYDIFIRDIELYGAERLKQEDLDSCSLSIITPQGTFYDNNSTENEKKTLQAQVKVKGKVIDNNSQSLEYYWFVEHNGVTADSVYYNKYGGQGWKCLNGYTILKGEKDEEPDIVEWIPGSHQWIVTKKDIVAKEVKYKCSVVYDEKVISKSVIIKNLSSDYDITITSDSGTKFYYDIGSPTLTCLVGGEEEKDYSYVWAVEDSNGQFKTLPETTEYNTEYNKILLAYNTLKTKIESTGVETTTQKKELKQLRADLTNLKKLCRIESNKIHNLQISSIVNFSTYKCSVYNNGIFLGTASIVITNSLQGEGVYSLVINEGTQVFKYDENGVSPASTAALDKPIRIKALTFTIYDNSGNAIDDEVASHCDIKWTVPTSDTLLVIDNEMYKPISTDTENNTATYGSLTSFVYDIAGRYNISKTRNNIQLAVDYKGMHLVANTNFTFVKEGDPGTNGTDFICKILPNPSTTIIDLIPMVINGKINYTPRNEKEWFKVQLWEKENCIYDGVKGDDNFTVKWKILFNKYSSKYKDPSHLSVTKQGKFTYATCEDDDHSADIIQVEVIYKNKHYFATYTLPILHIYNNNYIAYLKEYTGFNYALYSSDGYRPKYDDANPFEVIVKKKYFDKNGKDFTWEDISLSKKEGEKLNYIFSIKGRIASRASGKWAWKNTELLKEVSVRADEPKLKKNQYKVKPDDPYDGLCVSNAVECQVKLGNILLLKLHLPIHLYLNRYGLAALNNWDGNSIEINNDQGYILSPQMGAGVKNDADNTFTGILMGKVNDAHEGSDAIGLIGYAQGYRSIFLDAETGKAEFGKTGDNQIIIDPGSNTATIQSGNYNTTDGTGLKIDFSKPEILFGSGNFKVNSEGKITAKGGGSIAGWKISDNSLSAKNITISSDGSISASGGDKGSWYINSNGSASFSNVSVTGGSINVGGAFIVNSDGQVTASDMHITGGSITVGSNFSVDNTGKVTASSITITGGYIEFGNFKVDSSGNLTASNATLTGTIHATGGDIGGISITNKGGISGTNWSITSGGGLSCNSITISGNAMHEKWITIPSYVTGVTASATATAKFHANMTTVMDTNGGSASVVEGGSVTVDVDVDLDVEKSIGTGFFCLGR